MPECELAGELQHKRCCCCRIFCSVCYVAVVAGVADVDVVVAPVVGASLVVAVGGAVVVAGAGAVAVGVATAAAAASGAATDAVAVAAVVAASAWC